METGVASDARTLEEAGPDGRGYFERDEAVAGEQIVLAALVDDTQVASRSASSSGSTVQIFQHIAGNRTAGSEEPTPVLDRVKALASLDPATRGFGLDTVCAQERSRLCRPWNSDLSASAG